MKKNPNIFQTISINKKQVKVFDFFKIDALGFPINIIISERGFKGKTHNIKDFCLYYHNKNKSQTMWLLNTKEQVKDDVFKFIASNQNVSPELWKDIVKNEGFAFINKKTGDRVFNMESLSTLKRGSRDPRYNYLVYDEFNQQLVKLRKSQTWLFQNVIASLRNQVDPTKGLQKIFLLGNMDSLNTPLLAKWGILSIEQQHTFIYDEYGKPLIYMYCFIPTKKDLREIEERNKDDWSFHLAKRAGLDDFIFKNISTFDNISHLCPWDNIDERVERRRCVNYYIDGEYISIWILSLNGQRVFYTKYEREQPKEGRTITVKIADTNDNLGIGWEAEKGILFYVVNGEMFYDSVVAKSVLMSIFK